tara:strand:- start:1140 stop:1535 length:396 start_codon:yes stop_codon:yes gene_type:complete
MTESIFVSFEIKMSQQLEIELGSDKSHSIGMNWSFARDFIELAFSIVLANPITLAPLRDRTLTVSNPIPEVAPVTTNVLFSKLSDWITSSALVWNPKPLGPTFSKRSVNGIRELARDSSNYGHLVSYTIAF